MAKAFNHCYRLFYCFSHLVFTSLHTDWCTNCCSYLEELNKFDHVEAITWQKPEVKRVQGKAFSSDMHVGCHLYLVALPSKALA